MFIIFGTKTREKVVATQQFYCGKCAVQRTGEHKRIGKWFTLFFVPVFQYEQVGEFLECSVCHRAYRLSEEKHSS